MDCGIPRTTLHISCDLTGTHLVFQFVWRVKGEEPKITSGDSLALLKKVYCLLCGRMDSCVSRHDVE